MERLIRSLNRQGVERFRRYLESLRHDAREPPPLELLEGADYTRGLSVDIGVDSDAFNTRWSAGRYLTEVLQPLPREEVDENAGLWAWLSLFYFDRLAPPREGGGRRPGRDYRHIPDFSFRNRHRHLLLGPYMVYRRHGPCTVLLLSGALHVESKLYHEVAGRQDLIANRGVIEALNILYLDRRRGVPKRGCQAPKDVPGGVLRFIRVLQQLDLTYDIYGMSGEEIIELLPPEFDTWITQGELADVG